VFLTDKDPDVNRKVKKSFCEPGNADFCPPLAWVEVLMTLQGSVLVPRKAENGGDLHYTDVEVLHSDFASGALHPGDLKPAVGKALNAALEGVREGLKGSSELKNAQKKLEAYVKAQKKGKKQK